MVASPAGFLIHDMARLELDRPDQAKALRAWALANGLDPVLIVASEPVRIYADRIEYTSYVLASLFPRTLQAVDGEFVTKPGVRFCSPKPLPAQVLPHGSK